MHECDVTFEYTYVCSIRFYTHCIGVSEVEGWGGMEANHVLLDILRGRFHMRRAGVKISALQT